MDWDALQRHMMGEGPTIEEIEKARYLAHKGFVELRQKPDATERELLESAVYWLVLEEKLTRCLLIDRVAGWGKHLQDLIQK